MTSSLSYKNNAFELFVGDKMTAQIEQKIHELVARRLKLDKKTIATAESCTGGMLSATLTEEAGSSCYFIGGVCCYSEQAKQIQLKLSSQFIKNNNVVSETVAKKMAEQVRHILKADYALSTTGYAGPKTGLETSPVGTVWCAISSETGTQTFCLHLKGGRNTIRKKAVKQLLIRFFNYLERLKDDKM